MHCKAFVLKIDRTGKHGYGNGYVAIPVGHKYYGMSYYDIPVDVHGGLTYADGKIIGQPEDTIGMWIIGFDTCHYNDDMSRWPDAESVMKEALTLLEQIESKEERISKLLSQVDDLPKL